MVQFSVEIETYENVNRKNVENDYFLQLNLLLPGRKPPETVVFWKPQGNPGIFFFLVSMVFGPKVYCARETQLRLQLQLDLVDYIKKTHTEAESLG